jgi:hypothetical protein
VRLPHLVGGVTISLAAVSPGCTQGAREESRVPIAPFASVDRADFRLTFDAVDQISIEHVENVAMRAGISLAGMSSRSMFQPQSVSFWREDAARARDVLLADPAWSQLHARMNGYSFALADRIRRAHPILVDVDAAEALAWLAERHPAVVPVLRAELPSERAIVESVRVLERDYLASGGRRATGAEVCLRLHLLESSWKTEWIGQVMQEHDGWKILQAQGRRTRRL